MFGLVVTLLVSSAGAAVIGTVTGLFWLTLVALVGLLLTGAVGVSMRMSPDEDAALPSSLEEDAAPIGRTRHLRSIPFERPDLHPARSQDAASSRRAA